MGYPEEPLFPWESFLLLRFPMLPAPDAQPGSTRWYGNGCSQFVCDCDVSIPRVAPERMDVSAKQLQQRAAVLAWADARRGCIVPERAARAGAQVPPSADAGAPSARAGARAHAYAYSAHHVYGTTTRSLLLISFSLCNLCVRYSCTIKLRGTTVFE